MQIIPLFEQMFNKGEEKNIPGLQLQPQLILASCIIFLSNKR